jgi:hypothetical protein
MIKKTINIQELQKRRESALDSALTKITGIFQNVKIYEMEEDIESMILIMSYLKSKINFVATDSKNTKQLRYLVVEESPELFSKNVSKMLFNIMENIMCKELYDFERRLKQQLEHAESKKLSEYNKSIRNVVELIEFEKNKQMEDDLFSIQQNLLACLNYNSKIDTAIIDKESMGI